jgi:hypothetical protein
MNQLSQQSRGTAIIQATHEEERLKYYYGKSEVNIE